MIDCIWKFFNMLKIRNFAENSSFWWKWVNYGTIYDWELLKTSSESYVGLLVTYFGFIGDFTTLMGGWVFRKINKKNHLSLAEAEIGAELGNYIFLTSIRVETSWYVRS